jgi:hypothetical protein
MSSSIGQTSTFSCQKLVMKDLSHMIEIWMKDHFVSNSNCNTVNLYSPEKLQGMKNNVGLVFSVGDTKYHI